MIVSDRTGVVSTPQPGPGPWPLADLVARYRASVGHPGGRVTVAGAGFDDAIARTACVAEGVERYAALVPRTPDLVASPDEMVQPHVAARILGADVPADRPIRWLRAIDGRLVPLNAAIGHLSPAAAPPEDGVYPQGSTGLASALTLAGATESAAAEVVERDAVARAWAVAMLPRCDLSPPLAAACHRAGLTWSAHRLPVPGSTSTTAFLALRHTGRGLIGVGAAYRTDPAAAMQKAFVEAVVSLAQAAELADPVTGPPVCTESGVGAWRADRAYAAAGWGHVGDIAGHALLLLDPTLQRAAWTRLRDQPNAGVSRTVPVAQQPPLALLPDSVAVELTVPDCPGLVVVRVLAPGCRVVVPAALAPQELPCPLV